MGPNNISAKPVSMPVTDLASTVQNKASSTIINRNIKINYGDEAKVNRLAVSLENVKSLKNLALDHVENVKSKIAAL